MSQAAAFCIPGLHTHHAAEFSQIVKLLLSVFRAAKPLKVHTLDLFPRQRDQFVAIEVAAFINENA